MKSATRLTLGFLATALAAAAAAANADQTAAKPLMEEVVVTAPAPATMVPTPASIVMEEVVVTAPRPVRLVAADSVVDARAPDAKAAATRAALRAWLIEQAPTAPPLSF